MVKTNSTKKNFLPSFQFRDRDGKTELPEDWRQDLLPSVAHIQTCGELDLLEDAGIQQGILWLSEQMRKDPLNPGFWLALHRRSFTKVWRWAGSYKRRDHANLDFARKDEAPLKTAELSQDIRAFIEEKMPPKTCVAIFHERFLTIHPFQNGNGRTARMLTEHICRYHNWDIPTWNASCQDPNTRRTEYIEALQDARNTRIYENLIEIIFR